MTNRTRNLPGKYSDQEIERLQHKADAANMRLSNYIRRQLKLPILKMGAPKGNQNAIKQEKSTCHQTE